MEKVDKCSDSLLELQKLINKKFLSFKLASRIRMHPFLSHAVFTTLKPSVPQKPIVTPQELLFLGEKIEEPRNRPSIFVHRLTANVFLVKI